MRAVAIGTRRSHRHPALRHRPAVHAVEITDDHRLAVVAVGRLLEVMSTVSIIVPVLNEAENIEPLVSQIVANQTKIDAKLADLAETLRVARIFSSRSR